MELPRRDSRRHPVQKRSIDYKVEAIDKTGPGAAADDDGDEPCLPQAEPLETRQLVVSEALHGARLDKALVSAAGEFSRGHLQGLIESGHVSVDGVAVRLPARKLRAGQQLAVTLVPTEQSRSFRPEAMALAVLFEDEHLLVLDKPAGRVVHPAAGNWSGTVMNGLLAHHPGAAGLPRAGIVHRLDKDTSGVMVVGKTLPAVTALVRAIAAREVTRRYLAIAHGIVAPAAMRIDAPIGRDPRSRVRMAILAAGKPARTDVRTLATKDGYSALECQLHTGRTHQIRVHLASRGHPLVADALYGGSAALGMQRQALHAAWLEFAHPISGEHLSFACPPAQDFASAWQGLVGNAPTGLGPTAATIRR